MVEQLNRQLNINDLGELTELERDFVRDQVEDSCSRSSACSEDDIVIYVPGGSSYNGRPMAATGVHIHSVLAGDTPFFQINGRSREQNWHYLRRLSESETKVDRDVLRTTGRCAPIQTTPGYVCDEYPFNFSVPVSVGRVPPRAVQPSGGYFPSAQPTPTQEGLSQFFDTGAFTQRCLRPRADYEEKFIVISPPRRAIDASADVNLATLEVFEDGADSPTSFFANPDVYGIPSFGVRISVPTGEVEVCLRPTVEPIPQVRDR